MRSNGTSEQKFVVDRQQHDDLIPKYLKILEKFWPTNDVLFLDEKLPMGFNSKLGDLGG